MNPTWTPDKDELLKPLPGEAGFNQDDKEGKWTLASIIRLAGLPVDAGGFPPVPA
jgi:hypothetical protein